MLKGRPPSSATSPPHDSSGSGVTKARVPPPVPPRGSPKVKRGNGPSSSSTAATSGSKDAGKGTMLATTNLPTSMHDEYDDDLESFISDTDYTPVHDVQLCSKHDNSSQLYFRSHDAKLLPTIKITNVYDQYDATQDGEDETMVIDLALPSKYVLPENQQQSSSGESKKFPYDYIQKKSPEISHKFKTINLVPISEVQQNRLKSSNSQEENLGRYEKFTKEASKLLHLDKLSSIKQSITFEAAKKSLFGFKSTKPITDVNSNEKSPNLTELKKERSISTIQGRIESFKRDNVVTKSFRSSKRYNIETGTKTENKNFLKPNISFHRRSLNEKNTTGVNFKIVSTKKDFSETIKYGPKVKKLQSIFDRKNDSENDSFKTKSAVNIRQGKTEKQIIKSRQKYDKEKQMSEKFEGAYLRNVIGPHGVQIYPVPKSDEQEFKGKIEVPIPNTSLPAYDVNDYV